MKINKSNSSGFTLVEVIVVSIIVAVLAGVAIPIYIGYVNDAAMNQASNEAANFAAAVSAGINSGVTATEGNPTNFAATITGPTTITWVMPAGWQGGTAPTYRVPSGVVLTTTGNAYTTGGTVTAKVKNKTCAAVSW